MTIVVLIWLPMLVGKKEEEVGRHRTHPQAVLFFCLLFTSHLHSWLKQLRSGRFSVIISQIEIKVNKVKTDWRNPCRKNLHLEKLLIHAN